MKFAGQEFGRVQLVGQPLRLRRALSPPRTGGLRGRRRPGACPTAPQLALLALLAIVLLATGCGYHVSGHADMLPKNIKTIAVVTFANATTRYRITETLPAAITREFIARTRYNIVADPNEADAVLSGTVVNYSAFPTTLDPATGRATAVQVYVHIQIMLRDRATGAVIYSRPDFEARERYEIATDPRAYVDESDAALDRISQYVARMVVSGVLEKF